MLDQRPPSQRSKSLHSRTSLSATSLFQVHELSAPFASSCSCRSQRVVSLDKMDGPDLATKCDNASDAQTYTTGNSSADFSLVSQDTVDAEQPSVLSEPAQRRTVRFSQEQPLIITSARAETDTVWYSPKEILRFKNELRDDRDAILKMERQGQTSTSSSTTNQESTDLQTLWWAYIVSYNKQHIKWSEHPPLDNDAMIGLEKWAVGKLQPIVRLRRQRLYREIADLQKRPLPPAVRQRLIKKACQTLSSCSNTFALYLASCAKSSD